MEIEIPTSIRPSALSHENKELVDPLGLLLRKADQFFDKFNMLQLILRHTVFNVSEAAFYCRTPEECIRYHALRSRKLTYLKITKDGLVFLKSDLDQFLSDARTMNYRDHS